MQQSRALILDRDGVINVDKHYVYQKEQVEFIEDIFSLCRAAKRKNYRLIVTTNQSGIGRGYFTEVDFKKLTDWMQQIFETENCALDKVYYCPYHPVHGVGNYRMDSELRKPKPGMILLAAQEFNLYLSNSISVGDKITDVQAGQSAGVRQNFLYTPLQDFLPEKNNVLVIQHLSELEAYL